VKAVLTRHRRSDDRATDGIGGAPQRESAMHTAVHTRAESQTKCVRTLSPQLIHCPTTPSQSGNRAPACSSLKPRIEASAFGSARAAKAELRFGEKVPSGARRLREFESAFSFTYAACGSVIAPGAWLADLIPDLGLSR